MFEKQMFQPCSNLLLKIKCLNHIRPAPHLPNLMLCAAFASSNSLSNLIADLIQTWQNLNLKQTLSQTKVAHMSAGDT